MKHESTRGFERKSFHIDDTNRLADYISELKKLPNGEATNRKKKMCRRKPGRMAERSKDPGSRKSLVENSGTRVCARVRIPLLSENVLNTMRQSLQLTNSLILERQFKMTVQSKIKQKNRKVVWGSQSRLGLTSELFETTQNKIPRREMWNTNVRMALNANLYKWMIQTV